MCYPLRFRLFTSCIVGGAAVVCFFAVLRSAEPQNKAASRPTLYHVDPEHLWNRLHAALFVRVGPDGQAYGQDRLEPLLWVGSKHLLEGPSHKQAVALLEEFVKTNGEQLVKDPLKRAMLQRDLWLVFNWVESDHRLGPPPDVARAAQARLRTPLAAVINRLALDPKEIQKLPDNYAGAVASGDFARGFNPKAPDQPYLPADLFDVDGPWVCLGRPDGPVAPEHLERESGELGRRELVWCARRAAAFCRCFPGRRRALPCNVFYPGNRRGSRASRSRPARHRRLRLTCASG
jgi:hypothetical protein